jgi:hypothetical protein
VNIAVADPSMFKFQKGYLISDQPRSFVFGSLTGVTTFFNNESHIGFREICIKPFFHNWPRFTAVLGSVLDTDLLYFRTWKGGIVFGVGQSSSCGWKVTRSMDPACAPINGAILPISDESWSSST